MDLVDRRTAEVHKRRKVGLQLNSRLGQPVVVYRGSPTETNGGNTTKALYGTPYTTFGNKRQTTGKDINLIITIMAKFYRTKTCTTNLKEYLPNSYYDITHTIIAQMLGNEDYMTKVHTTQISACKRFASICFDIRETLLSFTKIEHYLLPDTPLKFQPDFYDKTRISIENIPIELPDKDVKFFLSEHTKPIGKTYYPGIKHRNKYYTTGTRVY